MFFVRKESINTTLGAQKEFAAARRRNIGFLAVASTQDEGHAVWHYLFPADQVEPSLRASLTPAPVSVPPLDSTDEDAEFVRAQHEVNAEAEPTHFIWSQEVTTGETLGEPLISPFNARRDPDWMATAQRLWTEAHPAA